VTAEVKKGDCHHSKYMSGGAGCGLAKLFLGTTNRARQGVDRKV